MNKVYASVCLNESGAEVLRFAIGEVVTDVSLTKKDGVANLKTVFEQLLPMLFSDETSVVLNEGESISGMYLDVCKDYIDSLNKDLATVRQDILEQGIGNDKD